MNIPIFTVDVFADGLFSGNTCAVCLVDGEAKESPDEAVMQKIAAQNRFSETAFITKRSGLMKELRWFSPTQEVEFCGHGTLAAAQVGMTQIYEWEMDKVVFATKHRGILICEKAEDKFWFETPAVSPKEYMLDSSVIEALGGEHPLIMAITDNRDLVVIYKTAQQVRNLRPDAEALIATGYHGYILTAPGDSSDYVFRYFSPRQFPLREDPVNGSSQAILAPFWAKKLMKNKLVGEAVSARGGRVYYKYLDDAMVKVGGFVRPYLHGMLTL